MKNIRVLIKDDRNFYLSANILKQLLYKICKNKKYYIYMCLKYARLCGFYRHKTGLINKMRYFFCLRKKNIAEIHANMEFDCSNFGRHLLIYHKNVVVNPNAKIGEDVKFHGNNCIGNKVIDSKAPIIGNFVDIGFGATIIGDVYIADNIIIGANSVVTKSFYEKNIIIAGNPARKIKERS